MRLRRKLLKAALTAGVAGCLFQSASCNVSPELIQAIVSAVASQVGQGEFQFSGSTSGPNGGQHSSHFSVRPGGVSGVNPEAGDDDPAATSGSGS